MMTVVTEARSIGWTQQSQRAALCALTVAGFVLPVGLYFWFIHQYALNIVYADQWHDIQLLGQSYSGTLTFHSLWAQYNENRILFPNLIVLLLGHTDHYNVVSMEYLSGLMLVVATGLIIYTHKRRAPTIPWLFYCPVAIAMLSLVQAASTLWGFSMSWYLVMLTLATSLFFLDSRRLTTPALVGAIVAGIVGSFSSAEGLLIWPVGFLLLYLRKAPRKAIASWISCAVVSVAIFFYHFDFSTKYTYASHYSAFLHPLTALHFFLFAVGNSLGGQVYMYGFSGSLIHPSPNVEDAFVTAMGVVLCAIAAYVLFRTCRPTQRAYAVGVALICYGLLFAGATTIGRIGPGSPAVAGAGAGRYTTFDLLIVVGSYLALIDRPWSADRVDDGRPRRLATTIPTVALVVALGAIGLLAVLGTWAGVSQGRAWHEWEKGIADITANIQQAPDVYVQTVLSYPGPSISTIRHLTVVLRSDHLALFGTSLGSHYERTGLPRGIRR
jgi:hypothetical protein